MLKFFGRGAGFSDENNGACFRVSSKLILMDCPLVTFNRLKNEGISKYMGGDDSNLIISDEIIIVITHTHGDHISGLGLTIHYAKFIWKKHVTVIAPSEEVRANLEYALDNLEGCDRDYYSLVSADDYIRENGSDCWLRAAIPTTHVPELDGKCFGYNLVIDGINVVYTGDTNTLEPFLKYLKQDEQKSVLYTECSAYESRVHIYIEKLLDYSGFFSDNGVEVFLMHLDNEEAICERIQGTNFKLAPLAE